MDAEVRITLPLGRRVFYPGETFWFEYRVEGLNPLLIKAVEASVLWRTEGKGDEDMAVHFFQRVEASTELPLDGRAARCFSTVLPRSPLSYNGVLVKVRWCARVRVFPHRGLELLGEELFCLGSVPPARMVTV